MNALATWTNRLVDLVFPRNCQFCHKSLDESERGVICSVCLAGVKFIEPPCCRQCALPFAGAIDAPFECGYCRDKKFHFSRTVAACRAEGVVRDSIHRFKYGRQMYFGPHLAGWLCDGAHRSLSWTDFDAIVPVPLHPRKQREREFNQAEVLAHALGRESGKSIITGNLRRVRDTGTQTKLDAAARARNLRDAFVVRDAGRFAGKRLALVDDVFTTGATMDACAKVLCVAGASEVIAVAVARGI